MAKKMSADEFRAAYTAACGAARLANGHNWHLHPSCYRWGRVPAAAVAIKVLGKTRAGRRDLRLPIAEYWPGGRLPDMPIDLAPEQPRILVVR
jgi:hypothetical protein